MSCEPTDLLASLPDEGLALVRGARTFAEKHGIEIYLVGGAVRDLLLGEEVRDLDFVWAGESEPETVATDFGRSLARDVTYHQEFLTATLTSSQGARIDLGRARAESYSAPAALPSVRPADLREDLLRRDFTVNAIAVPLRRPEELIDPGGGVADLESRLLRALHDGSFHDDPSRALRGCELAARRGFEFEAGTRALVANAVDGGYVSLLSGSRVRNELVRLFGAPERAVASAENLRSHGIGLALGRPLPVDRDGLARLGRLEPWGLSALPSSSPPSSRGEAPFWIVALTALLWDLPASKRKAFALWLHLARSEKRWLEHGPERLSPLVYGSLTLQSDQQAMAQLYKGLSPAETRMVKRLAASSQARPLRELDRLSGIELRIDGHDLLAGGASAGPHIGEALQATLAARRRGELDDSQELGFAIDWLRRITGKDTGK